MDWAQLIGSLGFPICACVALGFYVKYIVDAYRQEVKDLRKEHQEEIGKITEALNHNTEAITKLTVKLDKEGYFDGETTENYKGKSTS